MKNKLPLRNLVGLTQQEMATLLQVSRTQWSMFEIGRRDLPVAAKHLLAEILTHVQSNTVTTKNAPQQQSLQSLERLLDENARQQYLLVRAMAKAEKKRATQEQLSKLAAFLNARKPDSGKEANLTYERFAAKATQANVIDHTAIQLQQEIRQEVLQFEKKLLEGKIDEIKSA